MRKHKRTIPLSSWWHPAYDGIVHEAACKIMKSLHRSAEAKALSERKYHQRIVKSKKLYSRKRKDYSGGNNGQS